MSISREETIKSLKFLIGEQSNQTPIDYILEIEQAISDMEKLEKIIQLYEPKPFGEGLSREDRDREIEKIVEGE